MSKYRPLREHLEKAGGRSVLPMTFGEIEALLGFPLPRSSRRHRAFWSNNPSNNVMTHAWLQAGYETADVDLTSERLVFRKAAAALGQTSAPSRSVDPSKVVPTDDDEGEPIVCRHPMFGALKGLISVEPGYDLTQPLFDDDYWEKRMEEKYRDL
ncbi:DUF7662 domain-containing protein [Mongoliimonas terrestris]|uniref:DUF7662 domain-containing protein n=1 Tax=Mongoliimonas terrestris TaxID=1709001 RepID=UPI000949658E|nr:hypothetical protein [Mongoliimonas terrestris]